MSNNRLTRSERAIINLFTSVLAWGWPVLLALVVAPTLVRGLGDSSYGIRGLAMALVGYFAILDLGLNGAVTKYLAEYVAKDEKALIEELLGTTLLTYVVVGLIGGGSIWALANWFSTSVFSVPVSFRHESILAFRITGVGFFFSMLIWWGSAIPAGVQRFDVFNFISIAFGTITSVASVVAIWMGWGLLGVIGANVAANIFTAAAYFVAARRLLPSIRIVPCFRLKMFKRTAVFGSYMMLFRISALIFSQADRFVIGTILGPAVLTFYLIPNQLSSVVHQISAKMMQIIFPMASEFSALNERDKIKKLFLRGMNLSFAVGVGLALPIFTLSTPILTYWMSQQVANESTMVLQLLTIMYLLASLAALPSSLLSGVGFPQIPPIAAAITGVSGLFGYLVCIRTWGIRGVALASVVSMALGIIFYLLVSKHLIGVSLSELAYAALRPLLIAFLIGTAVLEFLEFRVDNLLSTIVLFLSIDVVYAVACWLSGVLDDREKRYLLDFAGRFFNKTRASASVRSLK